MNQVQAITKDGRQSYPGGTKVLRTVGVYVDGAAHGPNLCRTKGVVPLFYMDEKTSSVKENGCSHMIYDFIIEGEQQEFEFPGGKKENGYNVVYRWSTNPFTCIVKAKDVVCL